MGGLVDLRMVLLWPWLGALVVLVAPARWSRGLGGAAAGLALAATLLVALGDPASLAIRWVWVEALGLGVSLGVGGLTVPGLLVTCLIGQVAALASGGTRGSIAGGLALQGCVLAALLARDMGLVVACHGLLAPIVVLLLAQETGADRSRAALGAGFYLALATALLAVAAAGLAVAQHDASGGQWSLELRDLARVLLPGRAEAAVGGALLVAGVVTLGGWPVHGWLLGAMAGARPGTAMLLAGPVRWLGVDLLLRLWLGLTPSAAAAQGPALAWVAAVGALYGALLARAEPVARRALGLVALVPAGLALVGLAGQHHEGLLGAVALTLALTLGGAAGVLACAPGRPAWLRRAAALGLLPVPGLVGLAGAGLVVLGTARFAGLTLGGQAMWLALLTGAAALLSIGAMSFRTCSLGHGAEDSEVGGRAGVAGAVVLLVPLIAAGVWPARMLASSHEASRGWVDATARRRCEAELGPREVPTLAPEEPSEGCAQPLRALARLREEAR